MFRLFFVVLGSLLVLSGPAAAQCVARGQQFFPLQNDTAQVSLQTNVACSHSFEAGGQAVTTSVDVLAMPVHGALRRLGAFRFAYVPPKGYRGPDAYSLRVCAAGLGRRGCSRVNYTVTVR